MCPENTRYVIAPQHPGWVWLTFGVPEWNITALLYSIQRAAAPETLSSVGCQSRNRIVVTRTGGGFPGRPRAFSGAVRSCVSGAIGDVAPPPATPAPQPGV